MSPSVRSPVQDYSMRSPEYSQGNLVESQIKTSLDQPSRFVSDSSRLGDSGHSGAASRQAGGSIGSSGVSASYQSGLSGSGLKQG